MDVRRWRERDQEASPDRARVCVQPKVRMFRKVQVVYYLCRNGQLEHPHFMEVTHLANQQLRLKDVIDRLTVLRGRGMPTLFSWSCKRSYKNGYVWNDLAENDVIYPTDGAEYVLKGSEIVEGCAERFQQLHVISKPPNPDPSFHAKRKPHLREIEDDDIVLGDDGKFNLLSSSNTPSSRRSRGVSTDEAEAEETEPPKTQANPTELALDDGGDGSPPSSSSTVSEKTPNNQNSLLEDETGPGPEPEPEPAAIRNNSVLLQLIACGSSSARRTGSAAVLRAVTETSSRKSGGLHKGVLRKAARSSEEEMSCVSENSRFANPLAGEKEYFSGSIVETMTEAARDRVEGEPSLKKSSSCNEDRSAKSRLGEAAGEEEDGAGGGTKGKCIPRKKSSHKNAPRR